MSCTNVVTFSQSTIKTHFFKFPNPSSPKISLSFPVSWGEVDPSPLFLRPLFGLMHLPKMMMDDDECGAIGGMIGREKRSTRR
jgi:hypothetical protein